jgi:hypothetical protein
MNESNNPRVMRIHPNVKRAVLLVFAVLTPAAAGERGDGRGGYGRDGRGGEARSPAGGEPGGVIAAPYPDDSYPYPAPAPDPSGPAPNPGPNPAPPGSPSVTAVIPPLPPAWFYCSDPDGFYPYVTSCRQEWQPMLVTPPPPGAGVPPSVTAWAWCAAPEGYYPYVGSCPAWQERAAATPRDIEAAAQALWFYCEPEQAYYPYTPVCQENWLPIPAVPPPAIGSLPMPQIRGSTRQQLEEIASRVYATKRGWDQGNEVSSQFLEPWLVRPLRERADYTLARTLDAELAHETTANSKIQAILLAARRGSLRRIRHSCRRPGPDFDGGLK